MRVRVLAVGDGGDRVVRVATIEGAVAVEWVGELPALDEVVDVELDVGSRLALGQTVFDVSDGALAGPSTVRGTVEAVEGGVLIVRVGDVLVQVDVDPSAARALPAGTRVAMLPGELRAYPTGI